MTGLASVAPVAMALQKVQFQLNGARTKKSNGKLTKTEIEEMAKRFGGGRGGRGGGRGGRGGGGQPDSKSNRPAFDDK